MEMMSDENADVRYQALLAVQKLMSQSWYVPLIPRAIFTF
jgi:hypothetical protein